MLQGHGFDAPELLRRARAESVKERLRSNTRAAAARGVIGVPTYEVGAQVVWGQDRAGLVADLLQGWARASPL